MKILPLLLTLYWLLPVFCLRPNGGKLSTTANRAKCLSRVTFQLYGLFLHGVLFKPIYSTIKSIYNGLPKRRAVRFKTKWSIQSLAFNRIHFPIHIRLNNVLPPHINSNLPPHTSIRRQDLETLTKLGSHLQHTRPEPPSVSASEVLTILHRSPSAPPT